MYLRTAVLIVLIAPLLEVNAQDSEIDKLISNFYRLHDSEKTDSALAIALRINSLSLQYYNDSSLVYAVSFRLLGQSQSNMDSALHYYNSSLYFLDKQGRNNGLDALKCHEAVAKLFDDAGDYSSALGHLLQSLEIKKNIQHVEQESLASCLNDIGVLYWKLNELELAENYIVKALDLVKSYSDENNVNYADGLNNLGLLYMEEGDYLLSERTYNQALNIYEKALGKKTFEYANCLQNLANMYAAKGDYKLAESYYLSTLETYGRISKKKEIVYSNCLSNLGNLYLDVGNLKAAEKCFEDALVINKKNLGTSHIDYYSSLENLGMVYLKQGKYTLSKKFLTESLNFKREYLSQKNLDLASCLIKVSTMLEDMSEYDLAEKYYLEASEIYRIILGQDHLYIAICLNNLGNLYRETNRYVLAEKSYREAMKIYSLSVGEEHKYYAIVLSNLGLLYKNMGDYVNAEQFYLKSLSLKYKLFGENNPSYASTLNKLGVLYKKMGNYSLAQEYYIKSGEIILKIQGEISSEYADYLNNMGIFHSDFENLGLAEDNYTRAISIYKELFGENHLSLARTLTNLANLQMKECDYERAEISFIRSLAIYEELQDESVEIASVCIGFGDVYSAKRDYETAELYYKRALNIRRNIYGITHPEYAESAYRLGVFYYENKKYDLSRKYINQALKLRLDLFGKHGLHYYNNLMSNFSLDILTGQISYPYEIIMDLTSLTGNLLNDQITLSAYLKNIFKQRFVDANEMIVNYIVSLDTNLLELNKACFDQWLFLNGWVICDEESLRRRIHQCGDSSLVDLYERFRIQSVYFEFLCGLPSMELSKYGIELSKEEYNLLELKNELSLKSEMFKRNISDVEFSDLRNLMNSNEAYVDLVSVRFTDFTDHTVNDSLFYMAYIVTNETRNAPLMINLGDGKRIDEVLYPYFVGQITNATSATMDGQVYNLLWKPLEEHLAGKTKIYLSPGGIYHSINPETIYHTETGKYLFEEKEIHLVNSGRSFVDQRIYGNRDYTDRTALIMGAPNFDYAYVADSTLLVDNVSFTYQTMRDLSLEGNRRAAPLPATRSEVDGINQTLTSTAWNTQLLTGNNALESNLKQMESPRILHIATHGYFLEDVKPEHDNGMRMMGMDVQRVADNPMLRSGLLLAGCNKTLADNTPLTGGDNGILTAYEAGLLDLSKTELVVLSACETGKGEILNGEGVQGLRKAMTDAGAEHILMSLWKVDDKVTSEYMQTFYGHYAQGKSIRESYNLTRNEIKQKYPQPYYWGAFVLVGE